jgi:hypothetical protein
MLVVELILALAAPPVLLNPVSYSAASVQDVDGTETVSLFASHVWGVDVESLSPEQRALWADLSNRIRSTYATANRRQRARLAVEVMKLVQAPKEDYSIWLRFAGGGTARAQYVSYQGGTVWRVADDSSGQYVAIARSADASQLQDAMRELVKAPQSDAALGRARREGEKVEAETEAVLEVNAQRQYLRRGTVNATTLGAELAALLPNLSDAGNGGRSRILESLALVQSLSTGKIEGPDSTLKFIAMLCAAPCDPDALGLPPGPSAVKLKVNAGRAALLEPPDEGVVREFFGKHDWSPADLELSFKEQVKRLMSARP